MLWMFYSLPHRYRNRFLEPDTKLSLYGRVVGDGF